MYTSDYCIYKLISKKSKGNQKDRNKLMFSWSAAGRTLITCMVAIQPI